MPANESENVWMRIWSQARLDILPGWDELSELTYYILSSFTRNVRGMLVLEEGSGTGRISLRLAKEGKMILLDISPDALRYSKRRAREIGANTYFVRGSIFNLPLRDSKLNLIWNSGVLEHYRFDKQQQAIGEALRVLQEKGRLVVIVPNKKAIFYNFFRVLNIKLGRWKFGYEKPLSPEELYAFSPKPNSHHSVGVLYQFRFITLPILGFLLNQMLNLLKQVIPHLRKLDKKYARTGHLVAALWIKTAGVSM